MLKPKRLFYGLVLIISVLVSFSVFGIKINDFGEELLNFNLTIIFIIIANILIVPLLLDIVFRWFQKPEDEDADDLNH